MSISDVSKLNSCRRTPNASNLVDYKRALDNFKPRSWRSLIKATDKGGKHRHVGTIRYGQRSNPASRRGFRLSRLTIQSLASRPISERAEPSPYEREKFYFDKQTKNTRRTSQKMSTLHKTRISSVQHKKVSRGRRTATTKRRHVIICD